MPDEIGLDETRKSQLDKNIRSMLEGGASNDDVVAYATDFKSKFGSKKKALTNGLDNGLDNFGSGGKNALNSLINTPKPEIPTVLVGKEREKAEAPIIERQKGYQQMMDAYDGAQGQGASKKIQDAVNKKESDTLEVPVDGEFTKSVKNSVNNLVTSLKGVLPRAALTSNAIVEKIVGRENAVKMHKFMTYNPFTGESNDDLIGGSYEEIESNVINELDYLETQTRPTEGLVDNIRNFNVPGLAAATFDAVSSLAGTAIPSILSGGTALATDMIGGSLHDYNSAKAKSKGLTTDELYKKGQADFYAPALVGSLGFGMEKIGLKGISSAINRQVAGKGFKTALLLANDLNKEGATEWMQVGLDEANIAIAKGLSIEDAAIAAKDAMFSARGLEAYAKGFVGSGVAAGGGRVGKSLLNSKNKKEVVKLEEQQSKAWQDLANDNIPSEAKEAIVTVLENNAEKINDLAIKDSNENEGLSTEQKAVAQELNTKIDTLEETIANPSVSDSTKEALKEQVKELEKELKEVPKQETVGETSQEVAEQSLSGTPESQTTESIPEGVQETPVSQQQEATTEMQGIGDGSLEKKESLSLDILNKIPKGNTHNDRLAPEYYDDLKNDIKANGIKEPIILRYYPKDNAVRVFEGHHRLKIANELGIKDIPIQINVVWNKSINEGNEDIKGQDKYSPPIELPIDKYRERQYFPSNISIDEIGLRNPLVSVQSERSRLLQEKGKLERQLEEVRNNREYNRIEQEIKRVKSEIETLDEIKSNEQAPTPTEATKQVLPEQGQSKENSDTKQDDKVGGKFRTHTGEIVSGKRLIDALNKVADDWADLARRIREEDDYADHVSEETKDADLARDLAYAEEIRQGENINNFTIWQRINYKLTGESVAFLPSNKAKAEVSKPDSSGSPLQKTETDSGAKEAKKDEPNVSKTKRELATEARKAAKAKLDALNSNLSIANDPKEKAKAFFDYHVALVAEAKEYISEGVTSVQDFATVLGEKVSKVVQDAWDEATGVSKKTLADFEEKPTEAFTDEELAVMGITKKEAKRIREDLGEEQYQYEVQDRAMLLEKAERLMKEGYDVPNLIKRVDKGYIPKAEEIELIRQYFVSLSARINVSPTPQLLKERKELLSILDRLKTAAGRTVQAFDGLIAVEDNLARFLEEEGKYYDLTQEEIKDLTDKYNKAKEALAKLQEKTEKAKQTALEKQAQKKIDEARKKLASNPAIKESFKEERKKLVEDVRAELRKLRATPNAIILPYAREMIVIAPFVKRMVESHIKEGIYDLKTIVKKIHSELKGDIDGLREEDIRDVIAGQYPNPRKTRNAKLAQVRDLETQARLEKKIADLEQGIIDASSSAKKKIKSDQILELEKQIKEIKKRNPELTYPSKLQSRKTWYENKIRELKKEIEKGDFDPIEPPYPVLLDAEALKLKDEYIKFKEETRIRREKKDYEALSETEKTLKKIRELAEIKRVVQTSLDVSIPLRQGVSVMFNPRTVPIGIEAYGKMLNTMFSEAKYKRLMYDIENNPAFLRSKDDGMIYTDLGSDNIELRDESHPVRGFIHRIPVLGKGIEISARAAAAWTNFARFELYQRGVKALLAEGKTRENAKEAYEDMTARVMVDTGRGKIPFLSDQKPSQEGTIIKEVLGTVFYGARLYSSTFRKLNPLYYFNPDVDRTVRREALKDMAGYVAVQIIAHAALATALGASVSFDYDEPDFMKLRFGKRVIDLTAGQSVYIRTFLRLVHATYNRFDPTVSKADADKYAEFATKSVSSFWRNKLAPNTSYAFDAFSGTNSIGEKFDPYEIIKIYPMYTDDIVNALKEGSPLDALFIIPVGVSGLGYQEYSKDVRRARVSVYLKDSDKEVKRLLKKHQLNITGSINQEIFDINTGENIKMTKEQSDKFEKVWAETIIAKLRARTGEIDRLAEIDKKHEGDKSYKKKLTSFISSIKTEATKKAKESITGFDPDMLKLTDNRKDYELTSEQVNVRQKAKELFIDRRGGRVLAIEKNKAMREGKSILEAEIIAEKALESEATQYSKEIILKRFKGQLKVVE